MPVWKLETSFVMDSALPRDRLVITPHVNQQLGTDPQGLCDDLAAAVSAWWGVAGEVRVRAYDAQGTPPVYPAAEAIVNPGGAPPGSAPREVAICLSFYSERNIPRQRGRLYIPWTVLLAGGGVGATGLRPSQLAIDKVGALAPILSDLGDASDDWSVYSRTDDDARGVTNWWVDDEWDTIRSRGLRATARTSGTVSDG